MFSAQDISKLCGWRDRPDVVARVLATLQHPNARGAAPHLLGSWDGKTSFSHWEATRKVLGDFLPAQAQKIGSCVGAGASGACNVLQCVQIVLGKAMEYKPVSRAWCYAGARMYENDLGWSDGASGAAAAKWMHEKGAVNQLECPDNDYDDDKYAKEWAGRGIPKQYLDLGIDNLVKDITQVTEPETAADLLWNGYTITIASNQGFSMTRDKSGVCRAEGSWAHQMYLGAVMVVPDGRKIFGCGQSWGKNTPDGPQLQGCPDYVFGIEWDTVGRMLGARDSMAMSAVEGWPAQTIDWRI